MKDILLGGIQTHFKWMAAAVSKNTIQVISSFPIGWEDIMDLFVMI